MIYTIRGIKVKRLAALHPRPYPVWGIDHYFTGIESASDHYNDQRQDEEKRAQNDGNPEKNPFNPTASGKYAACIRAG